MRSPIHLCEAPHTPSRRACIPSVRAARSRHPACSRRPARSHHPAAAGAERTRHPVAAVAAGRTHHPAGAAGAEAVGGNHRPGAAEAVAEAVAVAVGRHLVAVEAASPTSRSSYPALGVVEPISKLLMIHACIASANAAVKTAPIPHAITPRELTKLAAISIKPAIRVFIGFARQRLTISATCKPAAIPRASVARITAGSMKVYARLPNAIRPNAAKVRRNASAIKPALACPLFCWTVIASAGR